MLENSAYSCSWKCVFPPIFFIVHLLRFKSIINLEVIFIWCVLPQWISNWFNISSVFYSKYYQYKCMVTINKYLNTYLTLLFKIMLTNCPLNPPNIIFSCLHDIPLHSSTNVFSHPNAISHPNDCQIFIFTKKTGKVRSILQFSNVHT